MNTSVWMRRLILGVAALVSIIIRIPNVGYPAYGFRQGQTAISAYWFQQEGISLLKYQTPLFGPPWRMPLEFPIFQATAVLIAKVFHVKEIDVACRVTALLYFYLSAIFLYLLCGAYFTRRGVSTVVTIVYMFLPYTIKFSTEPLIDYAALAFALGYLYFLARWFDNIPEWPSLFMATLLGSLGYLVKITTMPVVIVTAGFLLLRSLAQRGLLDWHLPTSDMKHIVVRERVLLASVPVAFAVPALAGYTWVIYTDRVKAASPFTAWLTSQALSTWNYGTWEDKTDPRHWMSWLAMLRAYFMPNVFLVFAIVGVLCVYKYSTKSRDLVGSSILGVLLTMFIFFNLYRHDYYYIALSASVSIVTGLGIYQLLDNASHWNLWWQVFLLIGIAYSGMAGVQEVTRNRIYLADTYKMAPFSGATEASRKAISLTPPEEFIVSVQGSWDASTLYAMRRKGFIWTGERNATQKTALCEMLTHEKFSTLIGDPGDAHTQEALTCWKYHLLAMPLFSKVSDSTFLSNDLAPLYSRGPFVRIEGGSPYAESPWMPLGTSIKGGRPYVLKIKYRATGNAKPFVILWTGNPNSPAFSLPTEVEAGLEERPFTLKEDCLQPSLILRNFSPNGSYAVEKVDIYEIDFWRGKDRVK